MGGLIRDPNVRSAEAALGPGFAIRPPKGGRADRELNRDPDRERSRMDRETRMGSEELEVGRPKRPHTPARNLSMGLAHTDGSIGRASHDVLTGSLGPLLSGQKQAIRGPVPGQSPLGAPGFAGVMAAKLRIKSPTQGDLA